MTYGGGDAAREPQLDSQNTLKPRISTTTNQYGHAVSRISVTQILEATGFEHSYRRPIDALADVLLRYISHVGKLSVSYANMSGRIQCNVFDVILALEEIASVHGFAGQSDPNHSLSSSGVVLDLWRVVGKGREVPFAGSIARFPVTRSRQAETSQDTENEVEWGHIPDWLPSFPDPSTYINNSVSNESSVPRKQMERPHFSFRKFFSVNGSDGFAPIGHTNVERENEIVQRNPYLVPPLPHRERQVSDMTIPSERKAVSVFETFAPVIEASGGEIVEERGVISNKRPAVRFRIGVGTKSMSKMLSLRDTGMKEDLWTVKEEEMDSKKRRAEMILKESMEKPNELAQL
ncbi:Transcription initiation factor TFIID subunit 8 [Rhynchospora pubera]|uniref:Transcription initiation factor TFIID subunit 8 n=1 Tax=Rhynchospora pubera TaxID=906938 RepID=A0AAV8FXG4_9POAL|nr:Transcription initiation factor TFIID subunit 8 [Rhynchospora pubera]